MRQGGYTLKRDLPKTILGQMDYRETQNSCPSHEHVSIFAALHGSEPFQITYPALKLLSRVKYYYEFNLLSGTCKMVSQEYPSPVSEVGSTKRATGKLRLQSRVHCRWLDLALVIG